ncbi:MAG TPA: YitT family protein [Bacillales bacterium]|nr:YitT family protein [Bacillales bacterium]
MVTIKQMKRQGISPRTELVFDYLFVLIGSTFVGLAFNLFLLPNKVASGGVSGISTILSWVFGWEPSFVQWAFNLPLFAAGILFLGDQLGYLQYTLKTLLGTIFLPFVVFLSSGLAPATNDPLLGSLFGGIGVGLGLGLVFRGKASTGGTDLAAQIIHKYIGAPLGLCVAMIDGSIVVTSAFVFGIEQALYALIGMYLTGKMIDVVQIGFGSAKMAMIVSNRPEQLRQLIFTEIDRGVTRFSGTGGYTDDERPVLMCVVSQNEVTRLKRLVKRTDPKAFVIVTNANEVLGEGFNKS